MSHGKHLMHKRSIVKILIGIGVASAGAVALAYVGGTLYFNTAHFNSNVSINGVNVSRMDVAKATKTINSNGYNTAVLRDGKVITTQVDGGQLVTKTQVQKFFDKQHTIWPTKVKHAYTTENMTEMVAKLNAMKDERVNYEINGKSYELAPNDVFDAVHYAHGKYVYIDQNAEQRKINQINRDESTLNKSYQITTPDGQQITVKNQTYGWQVNHDDLLNKFKDAFNNQDPVVSADQYLSGKGYDLRGTGYTPKNHGLGNNYILISLKQQKMWVIKDGNPVVTLDDVVTGTADKSKDDTTPTGVYYLHYKQSPSVLRGKNDDGTKYESKVKYWLPFTTQGHGIHDADWRKDWSKEAYKEGGSHGCINVKPEEMQQVWDNTYQHEPVVIYDN